MRWITRLSVALVASMASPLGGVAFAEEPQGEAMGASTGETFSSYVDAEGNISRPQEYRREWTHLGSWFVRQDDQASGPGVHDVYTQPSTVAEFLASGQWPDGATLVKEIRGIQEGAKTTGHAQWAGDVGVWFVMIRDRENRFPDNAAWGEGWGWALFTPESPVRSVAESWKGEGLSNCYGCHLPAQETEWVFIEGYPTVRDAADYAP